MAAHVTHALEFAVVPSPGQALDLGSGGGIPGLVLADHWPESRWVLLDANERRSIALEQAAVELEMGARVVVLRDRAERAAHDDRWRGVFDLVVARSFGPPAVVAECSCAFLQVGGLLVVSEPPIAAPERWSPKGLQRLGMVDRGSHHAVRVVEQAATAATEWPRKIGLPAKHPLW